MMNAQAADEPGKKALDEAHCLEHAMGYIVPEAHREAPRLGIRKRRKVHMRKNESKAVNFAVETLTDGQKETDAARGFVPSKREEPGEQKDRGEDKEDVRHYA